MNDIIKLKSRYNTKNYLERVVMDNNSKLKTYVLITDSILIRVGRDTGEYKFIDPSGGPMITVGCKLKEVNAVVKSITFNKDYGWIITFE